VIKELNSPKPEITLVPFRDIMKERAQGDQERNLEWGGKFGVISLNENLRQDNFELYAVMRQKELTNYSSQR
jgi:hypothetical protein